MALRPPRPRRPHPQQRRPGGGRNRHRPFHLPHLTRGTARLWRRLRILHRLLRDAAFDRDRGTTGAGKADQRLWTPAPLPGDSVHDREPGCRDVLRRDGQLRCALLHRRGADPGVWAARPPAPSPLPLGETETGSGGHRDPSGESGRGADRGALAAAPLLVRRHLGTAGRQDLRLQDEARAKAPLAALGLPGLVG